LYSARLCGIIAAAPGGRMKMTKPILLVSTLAGLAATAALAEQAPQAPAPPQHSRPSGAVNDGLDPNERICRSVQEIGSRLRSHRVCVTRAQWAEQMRLDRQYVEKAQTNRIWPGQ
jgi:hypothetical protein